jgi:hypothetical protein
VCADGVEAYSCDCSGTGFEGDLCENEKFCAGNCGAEYDSIVGCQCDDVCVIFGDCCSDYNAECAVSVIIGSSVEQGFDYLFDYIIDVQITFLNLNAGDVILDDFSAIVEDVTDASFEIISVQQGDGLVVKMRFGFAAEDKAQAFYNTAMGILENIEYLSESPFNVNVEEPDFILDIGLVVDSAPVLMSVPCTLVVANLF